VSFEVTRRVILEAVVIVGSILLAFAIDAAWDRSLDRERRSELIAALRSDFVATAEQLDSVIPFVEASLRRTNRYHQGLIQELDLPLDSLRGYFNATFDGFVFQPSLSNYDGAISSGRLAEIATPELNAAFSDFDVARAWWEQHLGTLFEAHYVGPTWELRRRIGTEAVVENPRDAPPSMRLSDSETLELLSSPEAYAAAEVHRIIFGNIYVSFLQMDSAAVAIAELLRNEGE
jgi:hypothetical protein